MVQDEQAFLAQIAMGWFSVDQQGRIWRHIRGVGSRAGAMAAMMQRRRVRAERSRSAKDGYLRVFFLDDRTRRRVAAHRIVWMIANKRPIPAGMEINHENGIKSDNRPTNLSLVLRAENVIHAIHVLGKIHPHIKASGTKITIQNVVQIRALHATKVMNLKQIAKHYGLHWHSIHNIVTRRTWKHVP